MSSATSAAPAWSAAAAALVPVPALAATGAKLQCAVVTPGTGVRRRLIVAAAGDERGDGERAASPGSDHTGTLPQAADGRAGKPSALDLTGRST
jgi:hypothetical protein